MPKWRGKNLDQMFEMMTRESDEQLEMQIRGWAALGELYQEQWSNLLTIRQAMEDSWTSEGGRAYLTRLNQVMDSLSTAQTEANTNARALDSVRSWIGAAQSTLEGLIVDFKQEMDAAFLKYYDDVEEANEWHDKGWFADDQPTEPDRETVLEQSGFNQRGKDVMDLVATEISQINSERMEFPSTYQGPKDSILASNMTPATPNVGGPGAPSGMPGAPAAPGVPAIPAIPTPSVPAVEQPGTFAAKVTPPPTPAAPGTPEMPIAPTAPGTPGMPVVPGAPATPATPGTPGIGGAPRRPGLSPLGNSRPTNVSGGAPGGAPTPNAPGKPGMSGKMAPPMGGMNPKGAKKGLNPGGPGRPGAPMGSPGGPAGKPMSGKMAPPPGGLPPRNSKKGNETKPGQPMRPANSGQPGKPGAGKGGKGGKPGGAPGGGQPSGGKFQAPPHIGRPSGRDKPKPKDESGYGKFGAPEGAPLGGAPRVARPGGSRPVLNNRAAHPTQIPGRQDLEVPTSQRPRPKAPASKADSRGVITPGQGKPERPAPEVSREAFEQKVEARRKHPETADYMNRLFQVAGLRPSVIEPAAAPKAHTAGPVIGT